MGLFNFLGNYGNNKIWIHIEEVIKQDFRIAAYLDNVMTSIYSSQGLKFNES